VDRKSQSSQWPMVAQWPVDDCKVSCLVRIHLQNRKDDKDKNQEWLCQAMFEVSQNQYKCCDNND
jgi:hypothetical protein